MFLPRSAPSRFTILDNNEVPLRCMPRMTMHLALESDLPPVFPIDDSPGLTAADRPASKEFSQRAN